MYKVVRCTFDGSAKQYEYRVPPYLDAETIKPGMMGIVTVGANRAPNCSTVTVVEVIDALKGSHDGDYAYIIGVIDMEPYNKMLEIEKKRQRLLTLMRNEKKRLINTMEFDQFLEMSPELKAMAEELKALG